MDQSKVREIVEANFKQMRWDLQLQDWRVDIEYAPLPEEVGAQVRIKPHYRSAVITIDPPKQADEEMVLRNLRHELLHLLLAPMTAYGNAVEEMIPDGARPVDQHLFTYHNEMLVGNLERMLDHGVGYRPWEPKDDAKASESEKR